MKSLQESLFDRDIIKNSDVKLGEMYELSCKSSRNNISNDLYSVLCMFDSKEIGKIKFDFKVEDENPFIKFWSHIGSFKDFWSHGGGRVEPRLGMLVNLLLNTPMIEFKSDNTINKYINKFLYSQYRKQKHIFFKYTMSTLQVDIYDDIYDSKPSSIKLTFEMK